MSLIPNPPPASTAGPTWTNQSASAAQDSIGQPNVVAPAVCFRHGTSSALPETIQWELRSRKTIGQKRWAARPWEDLEPNLQLPTQQQNEEYIQWCQVSWCKLGQMLHSCQLIRSCGKAWRKTGAGTELVPVLCRLYYVCIYVYIIFIHANCYNAQ